MKTTPGSKVYLKLSGEARQWYTVVFAGPQSLRLKRGEGPWWTCPGTRCGGS